MSYYPDLTPCAYFGPQPKLIGIGWLDPSHEFSRGPVPKAFFESLVELAKDPYQPCITAGFQSCDFCQFTMGPSSLNYAGISLVLGNTNLFIPGDGVVYVAPSLILHYIDAHFYSPPNAFQEAVMGCPKMKTAAYFKGLKASNLLKIGPPPPA